MSIDEKMYDYMYTRFEADNGAFSAKRRKEGKYLRNGMGLAAIIGTSFIGSYFCSEDMQRLIPYKLMLIESGMTVAAVAASVHFNSLRKLYDSMNRKNTGEQLTAIEIAEARKTARIGRISHMAGATAMLGAMGTLMTIAPIYALIIPILPFWFHYSINKGYGALYGSIADYLSGTRRSPGKSENTADKPLMSS